MEAIALSVNGALVYIKGNLPIRVRSIWAKGNSMKRKRFSNRPVSESLSEEEYNLTHAGSRSDKDLAFPFPVTRTPHPREKS